MAFEFRHGCYAFVLDHDAVTDASAVPAPKLVCDWSFTKDQVLAKAARIADPLDRAMFMGKALTWGEPDRAGAPMYHHYVVVAQVRHAGLDQAIGDLHGLRLNRRQQITGMLHDLADDKGVTRQDLRRLGFSRRVAQGVDHLSHHDGEKYFETIARGMHARADVPIKLNDNLDNMDLTRGDNAPTRKQRFVYLPVRAYMLGRLDGSVAPGLPIWEFLDRPEHQHFLLPEGMDYIQSKSNTPMPDSIRTKFAENAASQAAAGRDKPNNACRPD